MSASRATGPLLRWLQPKMAQRVLPVHLLGCKRREVKPVSKQYKPKKHDLPPAGPFQPGSPFSIASPCFRQQALK